MTSAEKARHSLSVGFLRLIPESFGSLDPPTEDMAELAGVAPGHPNPAHAIGDSPDWESIVNRAQAARRPCTRSHALQRLADARQVLDAAELLEAPDVVATSAIHAGIATADVIICQAIGERSSDADDAGCCVRWAKALLSAAETRLETSESSHAVVGGRSVAEFLDRCDE